VGRKGLTPEQRKVGVLKAIGSPKTPTPLKEGLKKYAKKQGWL
jgi:hypothetical protein